MNNIKLSVNLNSCLNPDKLASAIHNLTTTLPELRKVEVKFQHDVHKFPEQDLHDWQRRGIVRSLRQLERWIPAGQRLVVTGLDKHPTLVRDWNEAKRGWYWDEDRVVQFLRMPRQCEPNQRRWSWPMWPMPPMLKEW
jgi:hypothetical protein